MTTPTQAQIEAAEKIIEAVFGPTLRASETSVTKGMSAQTIRGVAERVITAAAQVGEPKKTYPTWSEAGMWVYPDKLDHATIERCAQVVEQYDKERGHTLNSDIAAAIRKLKDE